MLTKIYFIILLVSWHFMLQYAVFWLKLASKQNKKQLKFAIFDEKQNNCIEPGDISWGFSSRSINKTTTPNKVLEK